jgi:hypothetical protein
MRSISAKTANEIIRCSRSQWQRVLRLRSFHCRRINSSETGFNCPRKRSIVRSGVSMTTTNDLRRCPRVSSPRGTILAWQTTNTRELSRVANLGLGGLYIHTSEPPPPGTFIQVLLDVPTGEVRGRAVVQRSTPKEGMGVKFVAMQQEHRARFAQWLRHLSTKAGKL